jgi:hypothetical protein
MHDTRKMEARIEKVLNDLIFILKSGYQILVEADFVGLMFHLFCNDAKNKNNIHIDGRVSNAVDDKEKVDIIIGEIEILDFRRPSINPQLIIEAKALPYGFTNSQYKKRIKYIHDDIAKISKYRLQVPRFIIIYDFSNYLQNNVINEFIRQRNEQDPGLVFYIITKHVNDWILIKK